MSEDFKKYKNKALKEKISFLNSILFYPVSLRIGYALQKINPNINPNSITKLRIHLIPIFIISFLILAPLTNNPYFYILSAIFVYLFHLSDCIDGQLARALEKTSKKGAFLDGVGDRLAMIILIFSIFSVGMFLENNFLIYGVLVLFCIKSLHLISSMMFLNSNSNKSKKERKIVFKSKKELKKVGIGLIFRTIDKKIKPKLPDRYKSVMGKGPDRLNFVVIVLFFSLYTLFYFGLFKILLILNIVMLFFLCFIYILRIKNILKK